MGKSKTEFMAMRQQEFENNILPNGQQWQGSALASGLTISGNNLINLDSATIDTIARTIVQEVADGNVDALDCLIYAKKGLAFFKAIEDNVKDYAYGKQYASKGEQLKVRGCKVEQAELGTKYDWESTNSTKWGELKHKAEMAKKALEDWEKFLKTIKGKMTIVNEETGEVSEIYEPIKTSTLGYRVTIQ